MSGFHFLTEYLLENMYLSCKSKEFETRLLARVKISLAENITTTSQFTET